MSPNQQRLAAGDAEFVEDAREVMAYGNIGNAQAVGNFLV